MSNILKWVGAASIIGAAALSTTDVMAQVEFSRESSFSKAFNKGENEGSIRRRRDAATDAIDLRTANEEAAVINAANLERRLRGASSQADIERIYMTSPGYAAEGARMRADRLARERKRRDEITKTFFDLAGRDPALALAYAKQNGMTITLDLEKVLRDRASLGARER